MEYPNISGKLGGDRPGKNYR